MEHPSSENKETPISGTEEYITDVFDSLFNSVTADDKKNRSYLLTLNNYTDEELCLINDLMKDKRVKYAVYGKEIAPTTGTPHLHFYVYFTNPVSFKPLKKKFSRARIDKCKGTPEQCSRYTKKCNDFVEVGECPVQGKRSDIDHIRDVLSITPSMSEVVKVARSYQSIKVAEQYLTYHERKRDWKPTVKWFYGETGCGKTYQAIQELGSDYYKCMTTGKWFQGYDGHENILIDDMRKNFMKFSEFLQFIDRYPFRVETKGGSRQFLGRHIIITSCHHPEDLYETREDIKQLLRRIDEIRLFGEYYKKNQGSYLDTDDENE